MRTRRQESDSWNRWLDALEVLRLVPREQGDHRAGCMAGIRDLGTKTPTPAALGEHGHA